MSNVNSLHISTQSKVATVLLVEDNRVGRLVAERLLLRWGYAVTIAVNGLEALKFAALQSFDLILMNVHMPGLTGSETARLIRRLGAEYQTIPILALSANKLQQPALSAPFTDFLEVPYMPEQLQHLMQQHLSAAVPERAHPQLEEKISLLSDRDPLFGQQLVGLYIKNLQELRLALDSGQLNNASYLGTMRHKHRSSLRLLELFSLEGALDNLQQVLDEPTKNQFLLKQRKSTLAQQLDAVLAELHLLPVA